MDHLASLAPKEHLYLTFVAHLQPRLHSQALGAEGFESTVLGKTLQMNSVITQRFRTLGEAGVIELFTL